MGKGDGAGHVTASSAAGREAWRQTTPKLTDCCQHLRVCGADIVKIVHLEGKG